MNGPERRAYAEAERDPRMAAILDVLAPRAGYALRDRSPVFDFGEETRPTATQVIGMAREILAGLDDIATDGKEAILPCGHADGGFDECGVCGESGTEAEGRIDEDGDL